ncbi:MAG TPA: alpha-amylase family glycosyl hydrolase [Ideonella sp.]|uniref:alpha-amylase family glycosyl hydrolase n=1 Tax=Ideonella sp. TaxID=1929293 RepID=UPI002E344BF1|nr:alpha-amylase family glycosyl hydrolase [Ideonella sp.]HEX5682392.1 alpha-amylase family glycosyl hydrolase [Ideonella sp.]
MNKRLFLTTLALAAATAVAAPVNPKAAPKAAPKANRFDAALAGTFEAREKDWRNGAVVYQVLVDRFAPSANLDAKRYLYPAPKVLRKWDELPRAGKYLPDAKLWSHEIDFWGGDLKSLATKLDHVQELGADVLYLNPIHLAYTNHKYDALDYQVVSPEFGTREDVKALATDLHRRHMKLVLDGVFNHMGRNALVFKQAEATPNNPYRQWFVFGPQYEGGARTWALAQNLPELNLENPQVRDHIYARPDSVVRSYLRDGADGWRLDVAFDIGPDFLNELTQAAHREKPGSLVIGEIANYPKEWFPAVDGVLGFTLRQIILRTVNGQLEPRAAARMVERMVQETGIEPMLKSWLYLGNHDTARLATTLPDERQRRLAQVLQFTLPGSPNLYYGDELGMLGGEDPEMRAPMRWDQVTPDNAALTWTKRLVQLHRSERALKVGNFRLLESQRLLAFERYTDRARDAVLVLVNPSSADVTDTVLIPDSKIMDNTRLIDLLGVPQDAAKPAEPPRVSSALLQVTVPAGSFLVLKPDVAPPGGYTNYKRVQ